MIPANEFYLNKTYYRKHGKGWTPTVIDEDIMGKVFTNSAEYALNDFEPITLIPAIVEASGLKKRFPGDDCNIWDMQDAPTRNKIFSLALIKEGWIYLLAPGAKPFHFVHQFQNLYSALTHKELEIKL